MQLYFFNDPILLSFKTVTLFTAEACKGMSLNERNQLIELTPSTLPRLKDKVFTIKSVAATEQEALDIESRSQEFYG